jgi:hypothetical protein
MNRINERIESQRSIEKLKKSVSFKSLDTMENDEAAGLSQSAQNHYPESIIDALNGIDYINSQMRKESEENKVRLCV